MANPPTISKGPPENPGMDYVFLRTAGVEMVQQLSHNIWTDYNEHDPGVTTLEQLCYALTELCYRAELSITQLLVDQTGQVKPGRHGLFVPQQILPCNPLTILDYRKLFIDRVPFLANAWLTAAPANDARSINGLYDVLAYVPRNEHREDKEVSQAIQEAYDAHRNLCEGIRSVHVLHGRLTTVHATVDLRRDSRADEPESTLAKIFFALGQLMAPEPRRLSLASILALGYTANQIFEGPLLLRGFIEDDQLLAKRKSISVNEMIAAIASVEGVTGSRNVCVTVHDDPRRYEVNDSIHVGDREYLEIDDRPHHSVAGFSIRLMRNGVPCAVDPALVELKLKLLWNHYRTEHALEDQYSEFFPIPTAPWKDLARYYSIQNQYPGVYGIGSFGPPANAPVEQQSQIKQLKGYLLPFEQLMSNYFADIANLRELYSLNPASETISSYQSLVPSVPDVAPILKDNYLPGLARITESYDSNLLRRSRILDFLLSLYATSLDTTALAPCDGDDISGGGQQRLVHAKRRLLRSLVTSTRDRGRAFNHAATPLRDNIAGMQLQCRIELGLEPWRRRRLSDPVAESGMTLGHREQEPHLYESAERHREHIEEHFTAVSSHPRPSRLQRLPTSLRGYAASDDFLQVTQHFGNYFVGVLPESTAIVLACELGNEWIVLGYFEDFPAAIREAYAIWWHCRRLQRNKEQLYIVEHALLRHGRDHDAKHGDFIYSFTLTAVLGKASHRRHDEPRREVVTKIIRKNTPAHIVSGVLFLHGEKMAHFEELYFNWLEAMRHGPHERVATTSARLRHFLVDHTERRQKE